MTTPIYLLPMILAVSACHEVSYHEHHHSDHTIQNDAEIIAFNLVDSYGNNTEFSEQQTTISPFIDEGLLDVSWQVASDEPYFVDLWVNDFPSPDTALLLSSALCGHGEYCGNISFQNCYYSEDFALGCEEPENQYWQGYKDISPFTHTVPDDLYLILEVCSLYGDNCEYQSRRVTFE